MFKNYITTALRNLLRSKGSAIINIAGLTLGITGSLILFLLIRHYASFDTFHTKYDRIYRVNVQSRGYEGNDYSSGVQTVFPEAFKNDFPQAEEVVFTSYRAGSLVTIPQPSGPPKKFDEEYGVVYTQPSFFRIFDRKILHGEGERGLDEPNEAVISRSWAIKYFGDENALGEVVRFNGVDYKIAGVAEDVPSNTDFPFELMLSHITVKKELDDQGWRSIWSDTNATSCCAKARAPAP